MGIISLNGHINHYWSHSHQGRLHGLAVACWTTDHHHVCLNPGVGISEGYFAFGGRSAHLPYLVHKSGSKTSIIIIAFPAWNAYHYGTTGQSLLRFTHTPSNMVAKSCKVYLKCCRYAFTYQMKDLSWSLFGNFGQFKAIWPLPLIGCAPDLCGYMT